MIILTSLTSNYYKSKFCKLVSTDSYINLSVRRKLAEKYGANINLLLLKTTIGIHAITFVVMIGMTIITCRLFCYLKNEDSVVKGLECCTG